MRNPEPPDPGYLGKFCVRVGVKIPMTILLRIMVSAGMGVLAMFRTRAEFSTPKNIERPRTSHASHQSESQQGVGRRLRTAADTDGGDGA